MIGQRKNNPWDPSSSPRMVPILCIPLLVLATNHSLCRSTNLWPSVSELCSDENRIMRQTAGGVTRVGRMTRLVPMTIAQRKLAIIVKRFLRLAIGVVSNLNDSHSRIC